MVDFDWDIRDGELVVLVGPSGCGKTTILRLILGDLRPDSGHIYMDEEVIDNMPIEKRAVGYVPQDFGLFPHLSVYENVAYGLRIRKYIDEEIDPRVKELLEMLKIEGLEDRAPRQLSWGQQQRVALARALAIEPRLLLLDEPLSAIDWITREEIGREIRMLQKKMRITMVYVTHDISEAFKLGHRVTVMNQGRMEQCDTPKMLMENPKTQFVEKFVQRCRGQF